MQETLHDHNTFIFISGKSVCNPHFADNIDPKAGSNIELTNKLIERAGAYGMEINTEKSKIMVNSTNNISVSITKNSKPVEEVSSFRYLGAILSKDGTCSAEIHIWNTTA